MLIGDSCTDEYQYGKVERISPEAPVPVFHFLYSEEKPGMVFNVKANLQTLPTEIKLLTDSPSRKIRVVDYRSKNHLIRIDKDAVSKEPLVLSFPLEQNYDAIVVSDYDKGFITYDLLESIDKNFNGPIFIDTKKKDLARLKNSIVKINEQERNACTSVCDNLVVTLGSKGAIYKNEIYSAVPVEVSDVCGAGDTFLATLAYFYLATKSLSDAIKVAIKASAVTVQHFGTYAPRLEEYYET